MYYCVTTSYFSPQKDSIWGRRERERERGGGGGGVPKTLIPKVRKRSEKDSVRLKCKLVTVKSF